MKNRQPSHRPPVKRGRLGSDKRGPQHATLPRIPVTRKPKPEGHGWWFHYMIVPGLRKLAYIESRSGKNGCLMVSHADDRRLQAMARARGFDNPVEMLKAQWLKAPWLMRHLPDASSKLTPEEKQRFEEVAAPHGRTPAQHLKALALRKEGRAA
jgi:hypothetical protein